MMSPMNTGKFVFCRNRRWFFLFMVLSIMAVAGCSSAPKEKKLEKDGLTLFYRPKSDIGSDGEKLKLQHPITISATTVRNHLLALHYEDMAMLSKEKSVFTQEEAGKISPYIAKALNRLNPNNIVYFEIQTSKGATIAQVFGDNNKLNWKFLTIRGVDFSKKLLSGWGNSWRLTLKEGQHYYRIEKLLGKKTWENWVIVDLDLAETDFAKPSNNTAPASPSPAKSSREPTAPSATDEPKTSPEKKPELEEKLRFLKQLQEKGLIDEDEYKRKRKALVDEYL
jgi:hypothetical protein